jgi:hypothetical protein
VTIIDDTIYVIGGHIYNYLPGDFAPSGVNEQYTPIGYIPEFPAWITLPFLIATALVVIFCKQKRLKK